MVCMTPGVIFCHRFAGSTMKPKFSLRVAAALSSDTVANGKVGVEDGGPPAALPCLKRILVPTDFSACAIHALDYALMLASACNATLILLHVLEPEALGSGYITAAAEGDERSKAQMQARGEALMNLHRKRIGQRVPAETLVRLGRPWSEIPDTARALGVDLIVLGARGESALNVSSLGSTASGVLRHAHCPVLTVN